MEAIGKYSALKQAIEHACRLLAKHSTRSSQNTPCVCFDIDDTLIFDDSRQTPNVQVKHLLDVARAHGYKIHLITAREKSPEVIRWTRDELRRHCVYYDTLALCPKSKRNSMQEVSAWKHSERAKKTNCILSVGDQWGDLMTLENDEHIKIMDTKHGTKDSPWILFSKPDSSALYGLKLMA